MFNARVKGVVCSVQSEGSCVRSVQSEGSCARARAVYRVK